MGRRKIEIKAIKDDRNRSVTFLKRKGGLFKKAHELSVLCSVDVAVIIFGHNKKLYEFSSGDINEIVARYNFYGGPHEHKGPEDFMGKADMDDEDDQDEHMGASPMRDTHTPPEHSMMGHHLQNQAQYQHMRHATPSGGSPPMPNGLPNGMAYGARHASPQPSSLSRPDSRTQIRRPSSNLAPPQQHMLSQPPTTQNGFAYMPNPPFYNPQVTQPMPPKPPQPPHMPQFQYTHPQPSNPQMQQFMQQQEPRRQSMPPVFHQQPQPQPQQQQQPQPPQQQPPQQAPPHSQPQQERPQPPPHLTVPSPPQPEQSNFQSPPLPQPKPLPAAAKHSIFTPIEESRSMLAAHWGGSNNVDPPRSDPPAVKTEAGVRSQSIDVAVMSRPNATGNSPPQPLAAPAPHPQRTQSTPSVPPIAPPSRTNSLQMNPKRPRLQVQIPSEQSDGGSATADSSPKASGTTDVTPARTSTDASHSSMILPPPSPSANSLLSAGATGPPNPFARPPPPANNGAYGGRSEMDTPLSALPSRFIDNGMLPSPSSFYPEWNLREPPNMLPSPMAFQTPVVTNGPSFSRDDSAERKRPTSDEGPDNASKRMKT